MIKKNKIFRYSIITIIALCLLKFVFSQNDLERLKRSYAKIVYLNYKDAFDQAVKLQTSIKNFMNSPDENSFSYVKNQWLKARFIYGQTEAFRFFGGPIDSFDEKTGQEGPEGKLNAWPVNEAYIDYVRGKPNSGIVNSDIALDKKTLQEINGQGNEANVAIGYHAIEFLLWGQDFYQDSAGRRPVTDYANTPTNKRRRQYLSKIVELLVEDLQSLVIQWDKQNSDNFYHRFMEWDEEKFITNILTSLATLSGFELASERMATALLSGEQEDEHSCFSDNTHNDFIANQLGIMNVYHARYGNEEWFGLVDYFASRSIRFNAKIVGQLNDVMTQLKNLPLPIDNILSSPVNSVEYHSLKDVSDSLLLQAKLFVEVGKENGYKVIITAE